LTSSHTAILTFVAIHTVCPAAALCTWCVCIFIGVPIFWVIVSHTSIDFFKSRPKIRDSLPDLPTNKEIIMHEAPISPVNDLDGVTNTDATYYRNSAQVHMYRARVMLTQYHATWAEPGCLSLVCVILCTNKRGLLKHVFPEVFNV